MAEFTADRVLEISTSVGTQNFALSGAPTGYITFSDGAAKEGATVGDTFYGSIEAVDASDRPTGEWEVGYYTWLGAAGIERTTVTASSNNNQRVNFSAGRKRIFITVTAYQIARFQRSDIATPPPTSNTPPSGTPTTPTELIPFGRPAGVYSTLQWAEEFNGTSLDSTRWVRNSFYGTDNPVQNFRVEGGALKLWAQTDANGAFFHRVIESRGLVARGYGYIEIEASMPTGRGLRPIFGLHNSDNGVTRYIEICVAKPGETGYNTAGTPDNFDGYIWNVNAEQGKRSLKPTVSNADLTQPHKYGLHFDSTGIEWYFDGVSLGRLATTAFAGMQFYVSLALEMNSGGVSPADPNNNSVTPQGPTNALSVNYVRCWNVVAESGAGGGSTPTINGTIDWYGNSTVYGWDYTKNGTANEGDPVAKPMPAAFHETLPVTSGVNRGVNGAKAADALNGTGGVPWANWTTHIANTTATWVILQYRDIDTTTNLTNNLTNLVNQAKSAGKTVIIQTEIPSTNAGALTHEQIAAAQRQVASNTGCAVIDLHGYVMSYIAANGLAVNDTLGDTQHPKPEYYIAWGQWAKKRFLEIVGQSASNPTPGGQAGYVAPVGQSSADYPTIIFSDDFTSGSTPNSAKWPLQRMWYEGSQYANRGNIDQSGGSLRMWAKPWSTSQDPLTRYPNEGGYYKNHNATICTDGVFDFRYGYIEFRAKMPRGQGPFPALWLYGHKDMNGNEIARRSEIDVLECYPSGTANRAWSSSDSATADNRPINPVCTVWYDEGQQIGYRKGNDVSIAYGTDLSADFHVYACRWDASGVQFYFDGTPFGSKVLTTQMNVPMYVLIDYWMGGESGLPNSPFGTLVEDSSNSLEVDYVRVWALADGSTMARGSAVESTEPQTSSRDPRQQPFSSDSIWNMPIGSGATYASAGLQTTWSAVTYGDDGTWAPMPAAEKDIIILTPTAPSTSVVYNDAAWTGANRCVTTGAALTTIPMPSDYVIPNSMENNCAAALLADGRTVRQMQPLTRCAAGQPATALLTFTDVNLYGSGITGSHGGSGLSALGGTLRIGELRPGQTIGPRHALKCNVHTKTALFKALTSAQAFRWPAQFADNYAVGHYGVDSNNANSQMKMGALLAIPPATNINTLGLETQPARQLAWTLQNYGTYIVDDTWSPGFAWAIETGPGGDFATQFQADWGFSFAARVADNTAWVRDTQRLIAALSVVTNNADTTIGGGGTPRQPLAPAI